MVKIALVIGMIATVGLYATSSDVAEAMARKCLEQLSDDAAPYVTYLGAEPVPADA